MSPHGSSPGDLRALESSSVMCQVPVREWIPQPFPMISDIKETFTQKSYPVSSEGNLGPVLLLRASALKYEYAKQSYKVLFLGGGPFRLVNFYWSLFNSTDSFICYFQSAVKPIW